MPGTEYIVPITGDPQGWRYGSGLAIYTERLVEGRLLCASLQDNGIPPYPRDEHRDQPSFDLVIDGESLAFGWEAASYAVAQERGLPVGRLLLRHGRLPVELVVETAACGFGFFRRRLVIRNTSRDRALGITSVRPFCGVLWAAADATRENLGDGCLEPYSVGRFHDSEWGTEGRFAWQDIPLGSEVSFSSRLGKSGHGSPFFVLRNNLFGGHCVCHLAWSGNWRTSFSADQAVLQGRVCLRWSVEPSAAPPMRVLDPGEEVPAPDVHFGLSHGDFDEAVQDLHSHLRANVLPRVGDGRQPVILNHWSYMEHEMSEERLFAEVDLAAAVGAELFMVDAGWFGDRETDWAASTGDWRAGNRLPRDLFPVFERAREKGLLCGLWVEAESAGKSSRLAAEHPDWFIARYGSPVERILDLGKPEVAHYIESEIVRIVERYRLDMFRLDHNVYPMEGGFSLRHGREENTLWRSVQAIYGIIDRVRARFPRLQWENCAGGGGRTDIGMMGRATTTWVSDWMKMPRTVRILNGMSIALPPEYIDRLFGAIGEGAYRGNAETQLHAAVLAHPTLSGLTPSLAEANPALLDLVRKYVGIYKEFIRPFHRDARVYHHTPEVPGVDGRGWCALEYAAPDRRRAVAGVFRLADAECDTWRLRFRGLDPARTYTVVMEPGSATWSARGIDLAQGGVDMALEAAMTSRLLLVSAAE
jgi:alpha-galactosidase